MSEKSEKREKIAKGATLGAGTGPESYLKRKKERKLRKSVKPAPILIPEKKAMDEEVIPKIIVFLEQYGVLIRSYKQKYIARRLRVRMNRLGINSYSHYLSYLKTHPYEISALKQSFSINVTRFFRNRDTFELIRDYIVPHVAEQSKSGGRHLRIWSAGCAVGAEPYTIAMIFDDAVKKNNISMEIIATDVNEELLEIGKHGIYDPSYLAEMTKAEAARFFDLRPDGNYEVKPEIKSYVRFMRHDLMKDEYIKGVDVIFCRNVLIYIDKTAQRDIIDKFVESLKPGGYLAIGRTETLFGHWRDKLETVSGVHRIYQKKTVKSSAKPIAIPHRTTSRFSENTRRKVELKGFRERFEERRMQWEKRIQQIEQRRQRVLRTRNDKTTPLPTTKKPTGSLTLRSTSLLSNKSSSTVTATQNKGKIRKELPRDWKKELDRQKKISTSTNVLSFKDRVRANKEKKKRDKSS
ncbi:MAG: protein-glutamate O-methyltransferase CheR [Methanobacteriota archaeon]|nr:MAG: protein-glutamate O-methyltransferase CheR [Euryarchaeota archaeon]